MISIGIGYLVNHIVSTKSAIDIDILPSYCVILNHPVTVLIIVTDLIFKFYFFTVLPIPWGHIISTQSLFHGISSASLTGYLPYFYLTIL